MVNHGVLWWVELLWNRSILAYDNYTVTKKEKEIRQICHITCYSIY
jgi:hypothetical protein